MSKITWLNNGHTFWDQTLLLGLLEDYQGDRQVFVVPGTVNEVDEVNMEMELFSSVLVIITSDEEGKFPIDDLYHPNMVVCSTYFNPKFKKVDKWLPIGYAKRIDLPLPMKTTPWFFSGQVTHQSRRECVEALKSLGNGDLVETKGFAQGLPQDEYYERLSKARIAPCPMGNVNDDSFRVYEALELGCVPIPEHPEFWQSLFGEVPFPVIRDWEQLPGYIMDTLKDYPAINNKCQAWWQRKKREMTWMLSQS